MKRLLIIFILAYTNLSYSMAIEDCTVDSMKELIKSDRVNAKWYEIKYINLGIGFILDDSILEGEEAKRELQKIKECSDSKKCIYERVEDYKGNHYYSWGQSITSVSFQKEPVNDSICGNSYKSHILRHVTRCTDGKDITCVKSCVLDSYEPDCEY